VKILHFITSLKMGGAETFLYSLLRYWSERGERNDHVVMYLYDGPYVEKIKALGIKTQKILGFFWKYDPIAFWRVSKFINKTKPDLIHSSLWSANIIARFFASIKKIPLISDLHSNCLYHGRIRNVIEKVTVKMPGRFVAVSQEVYRNFIEKNNVKDRVVLIRNGVDSRRLRALAKENKLKRGDIGFSDDDFVIGSVGRLCRVKRYDLLIRSIAQLVDTTKEGCRIKLCLVGDGPERDLLQHLACDLGIQENVFFAGLREDVFSFYPLFNCFVLSSLTEGLSIAMLEAMSFGLPIVTTSDAMSHEIITDGKSGFVVPPGDYRKLSEALKKLYVDSGLCCRIGEENEEIVRRNFQLEAAAEAYIALYNS